MIESWFDSLGRKHVRAKFDNVQPLSSAPELATFTAIVAVRVRAEVEYKGWKEGKGDRGRRLEVLRKSPIKLSWKCEMNLLDGRGAGLFVGQLLRCVGLVKRE